MRAFDAAEVAHALAAYDRFGIRRMGSPGDAACAEWQRTLAATTGATVTLQPFDVAVTRVEAAFIETPADRIDGLPLFDAPDTAAAGVAGRLVETAADRDITLIAVDPGAASIKGQPLETLRRGSSAAAIVLATRGAAGALAPINAQYYDAPFGPPALQVAGGAFESLATLAAAQQPVRVCIQTMRERGSSANLAAKVGGGDQSPPRVLLTPRTSWWESTAERAGGVIAWIAGVQSAAARGVRLRAFSTAGHELGHIGLHRVLDAERTLLGPATTWLHLGANLGCSSDPGLTLRATHGSDADEMRKLLVAAGYPDRCIEVEPIEKALGEARDLALHHATVVSLIGRNRHFHAPSDRFPGNVSAHLVSAIARAVQAWIHPVTA